MKHQQSTPAPLEPPEPGAAPPAIDTAARSAAGPGSLVPASAGPLVVARAVFWSFFGVRRRAGLESDTASITPLQAIIGGLIGAALLVACLLALAIFVTSN